MHVKKGMNESKYIENLPKAQCAVICRQEAQKNGEKREGGFIGTHNPLGILGCQGGRV